MCWWVITFFVTFAVLDVLFAVNSCLNRSFFTFISIQARIDDDSLQAVTVYVWCRSSVQVKERRLVDSEALADMSVLSSACYQLSLTLSICLLIMLLLQNWWHFVMATFFCLFFCLSVCRVKHVSLSLTTGVPELYSHVKNSPHMKSAGLSQDAHKMCNTCLFIVEQTFIVIFSHVLITACTVCCWCWGWWWGWWRR